MKRTIKQTCNLIAAAINARNFDLAKHLVAQLEYTGALPDPHLTPRLQPSDSTPRPTTRSTAR